MDSNKIYSGFLETLKSARSELSPEAEEIVKKNCERIAETAGSLEWEYLGVEYKTAMRAIYLKFEYMDRKIRVDPMHPHNPLFPVKFGDHDLSSYIFVRGNYNSGSENGFAMFQSTHDIYRLDIKLEFNKDTMKKAEQFLGKQGK
jgi:hypothetical protein